MGSIGAPEVVVIAILALLVLGPERLPTAARTVGRWVGDLRRLTGSLQAEVRDVVDEVMRPVNETATVATQSFTTTGNAERSDAAAATVVDLDGTSTEAMPSMATSEPLPADDALAAPLAADVPLPRPFPSAPIDPSLN